MSLSGRVTQHYASTDLIERASAALTEAGLDLEKLTVSALAPLDHFHGRGLQATMEMANQLPIRPEHHVLDIGSGVGGPARFMADRFGCRVTGIDLTESFVALATHLTELVGFGEKVAFQQGNATELAFGDGQFDGAYTLNVSMNIEDKTAFFAEAFRVIRPGGYYAALEIALGGAGEPTYPLPWASEPEASFLTTPENTVRQIGAAGFQVVEFRDTTADAVAANLQARERKQRGEEVMLGPFVLLGDDKRQAFTNTARNTADGVTRPIEIICRRP